MITLPRSPCSEGAILSSVSWSENYQAGHQHWHFAGPALSRHSGHSNTTISPWHESDALTTRAPGRSSIGYSGRIVADLIVNERL